MKIASERSVAVKESNLGRDSYMYDENLKYNMWILFFLQKNVNVFVIINFWTWISIKYIMNGTNQSRIPTKLEPMFKYMSEV